MVHWLKKGIKTLPGCVKDYFLEKDAQGSWLLPYGAPSIAHTVTERFGHLLPCGKRMTQYEFAYYIREFYLSDYSHALAEELEITPLNLLSDVGRSI